MNIWTTEKKSKANLHFLCGCEEIPQWAHEWKKIISFNIWLVYVLKRYH